MSKVMIAQNHYKGKKPNFRTIGVLQKGELGQMKKVMESGRQEGDSGDGFSKSWIGNPLN
jgi:hypothetical protein